MKFQNFLLVAALMTGGLHLHAQKISVEYTSELQTDFKYGNFVNLLRINAEKSLGNGFSIETSTISIAKTRKERLIDDCQTFSNIEEDNLALALATCGVNWEIGDSHSLFVGIRNMNEDYFTSPVTSFFTNSSCGIHPTISCNYPIANYPLASVGVHYRYKSAHIEVLASVYNGQGYNSFTGFENVFRLCPKGDGVFGLTQVAYRKGNNDWFLGACGHYGSTPDKDGTTLWTYTEQRIAEKICWMAAYSHAFRKVQDCTDFAGLGGKYAFSRYEVGLFTDYACFARCWESATELSCRVQLRPNLFIQPTAHFIFTGTSFHAVSMFRLAWTV